MRGSALWLSVCLVWLTSACSANRGTNIDDPYAIAHGNECSDGQWLCQAGSRKQCVRGNWLTRNVCLPNQVCDTSLGCVECSPRLPRQCDGDNLRVCAANGSFGDLIQKCDPGMCKGGTCINTCGENADLVYLVDEQYRLLSFNPRDGKNELKLLGNISCPAAASFDGGTATPFSMSVDRDARAWVLYNSGEIFWVSTKDLSCKSSGFVPSQSGFETFGMGFVTDGLGTEAETLYVTGGSHLDPGKGRMASIDKKSLMLTPIGPLPTTEYGPELTGTGRGELWAYFPGIGESFVALMDKGTGMPATKYPISPLPGTVRAWAFAHWGGRYYIFVTVFDPMLGRNNSQILMFTPDDGMVQKIMDNLPYIIVGAGVSTCAPVVIG